MVGFYLWGTLLTFTQTSVCDCKSHLAVTAVISVIWFEINILLNKISYKNVIFPLKTFSVSILKITIKIRCFQVGHQTEVRGRVSAAVGRGALFHWLQNTTRWRQNGEETAQVFTKRDGVHDYSAHHHYAVVLSNNHDSYAGLKRKTGKTERPSLIHNHHWRVAEKHIIVCVSLRASWLAKVALTSRRVAWWPIGQYGWGSCRC